MVFNLLRELIAPGSVFRNPWRLTGCHRQSNIPVIKMSAVADEESKTGGKMFCSNAEAAQ
jgi:hypothetical protein